MGVGCGEKIKEKEQGKSFRLKVPHSTLNFKYMSRVDVESDPRGGRKSSLKSRAVRLLNSYIT